MAADEVLKVSEFQKTQRAFVQERDWEQFHTPKNLAMALAGEAAELLELFQWLTPEESYRVMEDPQKAKAVRHELADILFYALRVADKLDIRLADALQEKMAQNAQRYPVERSKGNARKYTEFE